MPDGPRAELIRVEFVAPDLIGFSLVGGLDLVIILLDPLTEVDHVG